MRSASWLGSTGRKVVRATATVTLIIACIVTFPAVHAGPPSNSNDTGAVATKTQVATKILVVDQGTVSSPLPAGDTTFIIFLAWRSMHDRFTFINENSSARGELRIAVANEKLAPDSDRWTSVAGPVSFKHKRRFDVSMLGVEARYVRLTFHVEHEENVGPVNSSKIVALN